MPAYEMRISYWSSDVCSSDLILRKVALLLPNRGPDDFIFANRKGGMISDMTISKVMRDDDQPYVPHGFRTSLRTWAAEKQPFIRSEERCGGKEGVSTGRFRRSQYH